MSDTVVITETDAAPVTVETSQDGSIELTTSVPGQSIEIVTNETTGTTEITVATMPEAIELSTPPAAPDLEITLGGNVPGPAGSAGPAGPAGPTGVAGPPGTSGSGASFVYQQMVASEVWDITHNLGTYPVLVVLDSAGTEQFGDVQYLDTNRLIITYTDAFAGVANLKG